MEDYRIELIQIMENAGRNLAHLARGRFLEGNPQGKRVVVLASRDRPDLIVDGVIGYSLKGAPYGN
jgi:NAD(P)H-hydrate repair Nnr-like enzyme with NAD(P)H-hydrate epimerase domain